MAKPKTLIGNISNSILFEVIKTCANLPDVRQEVFKNHDNNRWWPVTVKDWRLRMVIAGWSTRVSYNMISTYQKVVVTISKIGYPQLCKLSDAELSAIVGSLGLFNTRRQYLKSLEVFINELEEKAQTIFEVPNDELIELFAKKVKGASFKVAQCAVLYAKGYHCGIFPVDSGMKDMLGPCLGLNLPTGPIAHEIMRKQIEEILNAYPTMYYELSQETGYGKLLIPKGEAPIWWAHLVLIYFKRLYCNKKDYQRCPLRAKPKIGYFIGTMCNRLTPYSGGYKYVILEGIDKVGKTTVGKELEKMGYSIVHSPYKSDTEDIEQYYQTLIKTASLPVVFDRIFISEVAYGKVLRGHSRLSDHGFRNLMKLLSEKNCVILHLSEKQEVIMKRLLMDEDKSLRPYLGDLMLEYTKCMKIATEYIPVYEVRPTSVPKNQILSYIQQIVCQ